MHAKKQPDDRLAPVRGSAQRLGRVLGVAVLAAALGLSPPPAAGQFTATWDADGRLLLGYTDSKESSDLFDRADGLRQPRPGDRYASSESITLDFEGERPMEMWLYTALVQNGEIVRDHRSEPFRVQPGRRITIRDPVILEREFIPALDGSSKAAAPELIPAREFVPAEQVARYGDKRRIIALIRGTAKVDWSRQKALYMVAVPSIVDADVATRPVLIVLDR